MMEHTFEQQQNRIEMNSTDERPKLNYLNWLNLIFYVISLIVTYGLSVFDVIGSGSNDEISQKYQTIVTPEYIAFLIWALIFLVQAIFVIVQMLPHFRSKAMIQVGIGYWFIVTCASQIVWLIVFAYEIMWLSLIIILFVWYSLVRLLYSQYYTESDGTLSEFWLLRFPFSLHCGWLTAASLLSVNVLVVQMDVIPEYQLAVGIVSLSILHIISIWVLFGFTRPNYTIACVLSWAIRWIYSELQHPKESITSRFDPTLIAGVSYAAGSISFLILLQILIRFMLDMYNRFIQTTDVLVHNSNNGDDDDDDHNDIKDVCCKFRHEVDSTEEINRDSEV